MSLAAGTRLGPYEVLGLIGAGGMGEVYKARDTTIGSISGVSARQVNRIPVIAHPGAGCPEHRTAPDTGRIMTPRAALSSGES